MFVNKPAEVDPKPKAPPPTTVPEWNSRDSEGKWALYLQTRDQSPEVQEAWIDFLVAQKDYDFIEMIALYQERYASIYPVDEDD